MGYLLPVVYSLVAYGFVWLTGIAPFQNAITPDLIGLIVIGSIIGNLSSLGEELGWRGFLVPHLYKLYGFVPTALISGAVWALWHFPVLLTTDYNRGSLGAYSLVMFALGVIFVSFLYTWLRLKSGSIWPAVLLHTSHNVFVLHFFDSLTSKTALAPYMIGETGAVLVVVYLIPAIILWRLNRQSASSQVKSFEPVSAP